MRKREQPLGKRNIIGARVEKERKRQEMKQRELLARLQVNGINITSSALSKLEGQIRLVTDIEVLALAKILGVSVNWLLTGNGRQTIEGE